MDTFRYEILGYPIKSKFGWNNVVQHGTTPPKDKRESGQMEKIESYFIGEN